MAAEAVGEVGGWTDEAVALVEAFIVDAVVAVSSLVAKLREVDGFGEQVAEWELWVYVRDLLSKVIAGRAADGGDGVNEALGFFALLLVRVARKGPVAWEVGG